MTSVHPLGRAEPDACDYTYNLFRNKQRPEILCAVPENRPVPNFLDAEQWGFEAVLRPLDSSPPGFQDRAARAGAQFNGFYLFQAIVARKTVTANPLEPHPKAA